MIHFLKVNLFLSIDVHHFENTSEGYKEWPFDKPFYMIMNIAVGGDWGGEEGVDNTIWPQRMEIDYVRVYKN